MKDIKREDPSMSEKQIEDEMRDRFSIVYIFLRLGLIDQQTKKIADQGGKILEMASTIEQNESNIESLRLEN